ncbi:structural protein [Cellulophaga phage phi48:2]|uniref:structural protein n=1 Tax=Cellulophaga phage phi48:2 TaxID=1327968 RepID=UPI0003515DB9|nr:structural protein [Cellulophaga phage phi48:2]AGO47275.1 structural protein [Cellulophaga phage phi48:2]
MSNKEIEKLDYTLEELCNRYDKEDAKLTNFINILNYVLAFVLAVAFGYFINTLIF